MCSLCEASSHLQIVWMTRAQSMRWPILQIRPDTQHPGTEEDEPSPSRGTALCGFPAAAQAERRRSRRSCHLHSDSLTNASLRGEPVGRGE